MIECSYILCLLYFNITHCQCHNGISVSLPSQNLQDKVYHTLLRDYLADLIQFQAINSLGNHIHDSILMIIIITYACIYYRLRVHECR